MGGWGVVGGSVTFPYSTSILGQTYDARTVVRHRRTFLLFDDLPEEVEFPSILVWSQHRVQGRKRGYPPSLFLLITLPTWINIPLFPFFLLLFLFPFHAPLLPPDVVAIHVIDYGFYPWGEHPTQGFQPPPLFLLVVEIFLQGGGGSPQKIGPYIHLQIVVCAPK